MGYFQLLLFVIISCNGFYNLLSKTSPETQQQISQVLFIASLVVFTVSLIVYAVY
jgi:heme/copper-type cytochrome/quinol oxidase subunit 2